MLKKSLFILIFMITTDLFSAGPITLDNNEVDGIYIGKYIMYLCEKDLFSHARAHWDADKIFKDKMLSGILGTDDKIESVITEIPGGYKAHLQLRDRSKDAFITWGIDDVLDYEQLHTFEQSDSEIVPLNFIPHSFWLRFTINNTQNTGRELYLELDKYMFDQALLFYYQKNRLIEQRGNFGKPFTKRTIQSKNFVFVLTARPGLNTYYMRVNNWLVDVVPLRLWTKNMYNRYIELDNAILGFIAGIFILILIYSFFIFITMKDLSYLYLSGLALCTFTVHLVISGFGFQYLWPHNPLAGINILFCAFPLSFVFTILFSRQFIETNQYTPVIDRAMLIVAASAVIFIPISYMVSLPVRQQLFGVIFIIEHFYYYPLIISSITAIRHKNRYGYFLLISLIFYIFSQVEWIMTNLDIIPYRFVNYLNIKGISFIVIMIMGLGYKFRVMSGLIATYKIKLHEVEKKLKTKAITDTTKLKIEKVKEFLKENFREDISREGLASAVDMSPDHLGRIFKKDTGEKISEYINKLRIEEAVILLQNDDSKIIDIAFTVGFESLRTFNKVFLSMHGTAPSEFRKKHT